MVFRSLGQVVLASGVLVGVAPEGEPAGSAASGSAAFLAVESIVIAALSHEFPPLCE